VSTPRPPDALRVALVGRIAQAVRTPGIRTALLRTLGPDHPAGPRSLLDDRTRGWPARHGGRMLRQLARRDAHGVRRSVDRTARRLPGPPPA
jgi:hypothetical protein